jgi:hypothetical protein
MGSSSEREAVITSGWQHSAVSLETNIYSSAWTKKAQEAVLAHQPTSERKGNALLERLKHEEA